MASQWYYASGDAEYGPISSPELKKLADSGELSPEDQVWREGMEDWIQAKSIPKLFSNAPAAPKRIPPAGDSRAPVIDTGDDGAPAITAGGSNLSVGAGPARSRSSGSGTTGGANVAQQAGEDALTAFKLIVSNPVGGLADSFAALGRTRALQAGLVFGIVVALCPTIGASMVIKTIAGIGSGTFRGARVDFEIIEYLKFRFPTRICG